MATASNPSILALDVGGSRIGVALASEIARIANPLGALENNADFLTNLKPIISENSVQTIVVGYPRNMNGEPTAQTKIVEEFVSNLHDNLKTPIVYQDESITSKKAEQELVSRGKNYEKADIDALAAVYILEDYLSVTS